MKTVKASKDSFPNRVQDLVEPQRNKINLETYQLTVPL